MPGLREWLGTGPMGTAVPFEWDQVGEWLRKRYVLNQDEANRRKRFKRRHELYMCAGWSDMEEFVRQVSRDRQVIERRVEWVDKSNFSNLLRRVVNEKSTVYLEPATRTVKKSSANETYQELQRLCRQHEAMRRVNRWLNLHNNLAVGFRQRTETDGRVMPVIDVVTPDNFYAVGDPNDKTRLIALIFDLGIDGPLVDQSSPAFRVWTNHERFMMTAGGLIMKETVVEHGMKRMPWMLLSVEPPTGQLLDVTTGENLVAATRAIWFEHVLLLKESKSATKLLNITGDSTTAARGQSFESEIPAEFPDGVSATVLDTSMDLALFRETSGYIGDTAAADHGIAPQVLRHQGSDNAAARELLRVPLRELRLDQQNYLREVEREFVEIQAMVLTHEKSELAFDAEGWRCDFADPQTPLGRKEQAEVFEHERQLGLTDTLEEIMRRNPDLSEKDALEELAKHVSREVVRNVMMRPLQQISGSMGAEQGEQQGAQSAPPNGQPMNGSRPPRATGDETVPPTSRARERRDA